MKLNFEVLFLMTSVVAVIFCGDPETCRPKLIKCSWSWYSLDIFSFTKDIRNLCNSKTEIPDCLKEEPDCQTLNMSLGNMTVLKGFEKMYSIFCIPGGSEYKDAYMKNEKCLHDTATVMHLACGFGSLTGCPDEVEEKWKCAYPKIQRCMKNAILNSCGRTAAVAYMKIETEVSCAMMNQKELYCRDHTRLRPSRFYYNVKNRKSNRIKDNEEGA